jgi:hypothetical protein
MNVVRPRVICFPMFEVLPSSTPEKCLQIGRRNCFQELALRNAFGPAESGGNF